MSFRSRVRPVVQIEDEHVDVAIVVVVAERSAATRLLQEEPRRPLRSVTFAESVCSPGSGTAASVCRYVVPRFVTVDVGIHVAVCDEQIEEAVVVHVHEARRPIP